MPLAFHLTQDPISSSSSPALSSGNRQGCATVGVCVPPVAPCLRSNVYNNSDPGMEAAALLPGPGLAVRRLTPMECERLQGFPDGYTGIPGAADGPRYKALGNSMAVPCMRWIGRRIDFVDRVLRMLDS